MILNSPYISGSLTVTGNEVVTGSLTVLGGITGAITGSATSASYAANTSLLNNKDSGEFVLTGSFNSYTSSNDATVTSVAAAAVSAVAGVNALAARTGSYTTTSSFNSYTASNNTTMSCVSSTATSAIAGVGALAAQTGSYATTGSNTFVGGQYLSSSFNPTGFSTTASLYTDGGLRVTRDAYISGTLYLNNVTVFGTQSVAYISSSQLNIGTNIISVNTDTPSVRFGGLAVYDSGSTGLTGSILWDSQDNQWIYSNPSGSTYDSAMFLVGPRNTGALGGEAGINCNFLAKGNGLHHMTSSAIFENGSVTCIGTGASITSAGIACFSNQICAQGATFTTTGNTAVTIASGATGLSRLIFQGTVGNARGFVDYDNSTCGFIIRTNESTALTISNAGVTCFASTVCAPAFVGGTVDGTIINSTSNAFRFGGNNALSLVSLCSQNVVKINAAGYWGVQLVGANDRGIVIDNTGLVGIGTIPSAWGAPFIAIQGGTFGQHIGFQTNNADMKIGVNNFYNGSNYIYHTTGKQASQLNISADGGLVFSTAASGTAGNAITWADAFFITNPGRVGVGIASPVYQFDICTSNYKSLRIQSSDDALITLGSTLASSQFYSIGVSSNLSGQGSNLFWIGTSTNNPSGTLTKNLTITSAGNVGIGTSSPVTFGTRNLDVNAGSGGAAYIVARANSNAGTMELAFDTDAGYLSTKSNHPLLFRTNDIVRMRIHCGGNITIGGTCDSGDRLRVEGSVLATSSVYTSNEGTGFMVDANPAACNARVGLMKYGGFEGMLVSGNTIQVRLGHRTDSNFVSGGSPTIRVDMAITPDGQVFMYYLGASAGTHAARYSTSTGQLTYDTSSCRYKNNIRNSTYGLSQIMNLRSTMFEYKEDDRTDIGLIAEEVYEVIPELVSLDKEEKPNSVSYDRMVSVLVKGMQEQQCTICSQASMINTLKTCLGII